jgi:S1-C subfamily serine protease
MQARPQIKKMAAFDLYQHFPCHIVAPTVRERTFGSFGLPNGRQTTPTMRYCRQAADLQGGRKETKVKTFGKYVAAVALACVITSCVQAQTTVRNAIAKIYTVYNEHNYYDPWQMKGQRTSNGSGCIIDGQKIITNAHVVANQTFIQVKRAGHAKKYMAKVEAVAHECDLAILTVADQAFFADTEPIGIGELAKIRDKVAVYGFPTGGDELAITEGVVSRIEHCEYVHSEARLLTCQIDAAINPGSSGGPVIKDGKIVGIAFQGGGGENIGYMVPVPVINHFLADIKDGKYDGIPDLGISIQEMENPDIRLKYGMDKQQTGVLVNKIYPDSAAKGLLESGDVILSVDDENIENDATIEFRKNERTFYTYIMQNKYIDDTITFEVLRANKVMPVKIKLFEKIGASNLSPDDQYDIAPTYYIAGGLVFEPLTVNFLKEWGRQWYAEAPTHLVNYYVRGEPTEDRKQIVILVKVLADEVNRGYHNWSYNVISSVNGKRISNITDLVSAIEEHQGKYHVIEDERGGKLILDRIKVDDSTERILRRYKITSDRSEDLQR